MRSFSYRPPGSSSGIPEEILDGWSSQGAVTTAKATHERIERIVNSIEFPYRKPLVYLQGSYRNTTNIVGESDVDVVVEWWPPPHAIKQSDEVNLFLNYRRTIEQALIHNFSGVKPEKKCIKIFRTSNTIPADVVPAFYFTPWMDFYYLQPSIKPSNAMRFFVFQENRWIINYPKSHAWNGEDKNKATNGNFKPFVRIVKNALKYGGYRFPGYFLECMLFNVPNWEFLGRSHRDRYCNVVSWLSRTDKRLFVCQNGQHYLFGDTPEQWDVQSAEGAILCLREIWNQYRKSGTVS